RVVSLVPSITESLFDLNVGQRLVGVTDSCIYPQAGVAQLPRIGGTQNPDIERILELRPDLVIANVDENRREDVEKLRDAGLQVWATFPRTVAEAINLLWNLMQVFDEPAMVPRVRLIEQTLDWVAGISRESEDHPTRVFAPIWLDPLMTFNGDTYSHDLLRVCGGLNVFSDHQRHSLSADRSESEAHSPEHSEGLATRYPRITLEEVVTAQPDVILLPSKPLAFSDAHLPMFTTLDVPAARTGRVHLVDGSLLTWPGTRLAYALNTIPALLLSEARE
ncbi:MAG: helical backbone metal receptor, partial [Anaerolineae bacterium]|nr:helical backbone metal receptor [Anaerolineae bacterium]